MILFKNDWNKYPDAIVHTSSSNKTFVRLAGVYKAMGIENHSFCLALLDPDLEFVNPHNPSISSNDIYRVVRECKVNPWYYFREILRLPALSGTDTIPLRGNRGNISLYWLFFNHITSMLIQPRQTGKSVSTDGVMTYLFNIATVNTDFSLLTKDNDLRVKNVTRIKEMLANLPFYLNIRTKRDSNNTEKLTLENLGNTYHTSVAQASPKAALNLGRGMTIAINHIDEIAYIKNIDITLPALLAASGAARDAAKLNNAPYGNIFTTTPGYLSSTSGQFAYKIYNESLRFSEKLFDCVDEEELIKTIKLNNHSKKIQVLIEYNHRQLGFEDEWLRGKIADAMSSGEDAGADFLNLWAVGSETSPIPKDILKAIQNSQVNDPYVEISKYGYMTRWYVRESEVSDGLPERKLVMALDTSDAVGSDDIAMTIRDATTGEIIAAGTYNETNLVTFSEWIADWVITYTNITIIIERRSSGVMIIDNLLKILPLHNIDPFKRLFNWVVNDSDTVDAYRNEVTKVPMSRRDGMVYTRYRKQFGYATSGSGRASRDNLYGTAFNNATKYTGNTTRDKTLIHQIGSLVRRNGRIDHHAGEHDDMVVSWLLGYWFLSEAKNKTFYGLSNHIVLATVTSAIIEEKGGREEIIHKNRQFRIKNMIEELVTELKIERNPIIIERLTNRIKHLYKDIDTSETRSVNLETLLENISLEKRRNRMIM